MRFPTELTGIAGAQELYDWFGCWPQFHDAEVLSLHLNRTGSSVLTVHAWDMTDHVDSDGFYVLQKHVIVRFLLDGITESSFEDFNHQNVLFSLRLTKQDDGFNLTLDSSFGQSGSILAKNVAIEMTPGAPERDEDSGLQQGGARPLTRRKLSAVRSLRRGPNERAAERLRDFSRGRELAMDAKIKNLKPRSGSRLWRMERRRLHRDAPALRGDRS